MVTYWFRIASWLEKKHGLYKIPAFIAKLWYRHIAFKTTIQLPLGTQIGGGLRFVHFGTIIIHKASRIGTNCKIFQGVTIGKTNKGVPTIGNNVTIFANAVVIGPVNIGDNAVIGAGAVVTKSIPANAVAVGNPIRILPGQATGLADNF